MKLNKQRLPCAPGTSKAEIAFLNVVQLQETLTIADVKKLSSVCSTLNAVANDPYVWRKYLAKELHIATCALQFPLDGTARLENDRTYKPYKELYRGYRLIDGERGPRIPTNRWDSAQKNCVRRVTPFLELNFPGLFESIAERHVLYAASRSEQHRFVEDTVSMGAALTGGAAGLSAGFATSASKAANITATSAAKKVAISKLVKLIGFKATKVLLVGVAGYTAAASGLVALGFGAITYHQYQQLQAELRILERQINATKIQAHLAMMRVQAGLEQQIKINPLAGLREVRASRVDNNG